LDTRNEKREVDLWQPWSDLDPNPLAHTRKTALPAAIGLVQIVRMGKKRKSTNRYYWVAVIK